MLKHLSEKAGSILQLLVFAIFLLPISAFGQELFTIDEAITEKVKYLSERLPKGTRIAILNVESDIEKLSDYVMEESDMLIMNDDKLSWVDKRAFSGILQRITTLDGVDEDVALRIGKELGVTTVVLTRISALGDNYRFRVRALSVSDGDVQGILSLNVRRDAVLSDLAGQARVPVVAPVQLAAPRVTADVAFTEVNRPVSVSHRNAGTVRYSDVALPIESRPAISRPALTEAEGGRFVFSIRYELIASSPVVSNGVGFELGGINQGGAYITSQFSWFTNGANSNAGFGGGFNLGGCIDNGTGTKNVLGVTLDIRRLNYYIISDRRNQVSQPMASVFTIGENLTICGVFWKLMFGRDYNFDITNKFLLGSQNRPVGNYSGRHYKGANVGFTYILGIGYTLTRSKR
jgi:hypothetical protein